MAKGSDIVAVAQRHLGEKYILGQLVPKDNASWKGPWDCAEFASWCLYQVTERLYGCGNNASNPAVADAYSGFWQRDARKLGRAVTISVAAATPGAFVVRYPAGRLIGHVAICAGGDRTIEAHSSATGVIRSSVSGRRWDTGVLIPWIEYGTINVAPVAPAGLVLRLKKPNMKGELVRRVQLALKAKGFDVGEVDGAYGPHTAAAVSAYQASVGLVNDGEVGPLTAQSLQIDWIV